MRQACLLAFAAAGMLSLTVGCGNIDADAKGGSAARKPIKELLVGKWSIEFVFDKNGVTERNLALQNRLSQFKMSMEFKADGTTAKTMKIPDYVPPADLGKWEIVDESAKTIKMKLTEKSRGKMSSRIVEIVVDGNDRFRIVKDEKFKGSPDVPGLKEVVFKRMK